MGDYMFKKSHLKYVKISIIIFIFLCLILVIFYNYKNNKSVKTNAVPASNKIIILDSGHGLPDNGATGFYMTSEQEINLKITLKIQKLLEQSGSVVLLTRSDENGIYDISSDTIREKKISDIKNRVNIINTSKADILISIHLNKYAASSAYSGWQTFYKENNDESKKLATAIQSNLNKNIDDNNDRIPMKIKDVYLIEKSNIPSVIVECGFLSNKEECENLKKDDYQENLAWGIFLGIQDYFEKKES